MIFGLLGRGFGRLGAAGLKRSTGGGGSNFELREDGSVELREDGSKELRE
jgi:hypothetical protein